MIKTWCWVACVFMGWMQSGAADVLIVADELPAMQYVAERLKAEENIASQVATQDKLPPNLGPFTAVIAYIHGDLAETTERALIQYVQAGGRLIALHHSISSGKRKNKEWFSFLGIQLLTGDVSEGGYKWIEGVTLEVVNLAPDHFITTNKIHYSTNIVYTPTNVGGGTQPRPGFILTKSEVYINHTYTDPRTILLGFKYTDDKSGKVYMQDRAGWLKPSGKGLILYFLPGHTIDDFKDPVYGRMVLNAVTFKP
jgi:hypothetical protein